MSTIGGITAEEYSFAVADLTKTLFIPKILGLTHILHHSQEQAFRPVKRENSIFVEQAEKPVPKQVIENGATSQFEDTYLETRLMA
ncbi:hypothetical protein QUB05_10990 [Microcoleus sp. F10-C6]|uniref:hypothetical protein n=1 Tax=unclassified Microcoleus TaxID=2642155 RepID=UPI002FD78865